MPRASSNVGKCLSIKDKVKYQELGKDWGITDGRGFLNIPH
jgi:hypothetical protein